jgi:hypothetical protein
LIIYFNFIFFHFLYLADNNSHSHSPSSIVNNLEFNFNSSMKREIIKFDDYSHLDDIKSIITDSTKNTSINSTNASHRENKKIINPSAPDPPMNKEEISTFNKSFKERLKNSARLFNLDNLSA